MHTTHRQRTRMARWERINEVGAACILVAATMGAMYLAVVILSR